MRVVNPPARIDRADYDRELAAYVAKAKDVPGVCAVATMGSVKAPGLSDLDVIVVVADEYEGRDSKRLDVRDLDRRIFLHGPMIVTRSHAANIQHLIFATDLDVVWGEACFECFKDLSLEVQRALALAYVIDFTEARLCQFSRVVDELDMRAWMTRLWSFVHTQALCEIAGVEIQAESRLVLERIRRLRSDWVAGDEVNEEALLELFYAALGLAREVFASALRALEVRLEIDVQTKLRTPLQLIERNKRVVCEPYRDTVDVTGRRVHVGSRSRLYETTWAPSRYALQMALYDQGSSFDWHFDAENPVVRTAGVRAAAVRTHDTFLTKVGIPFSLRGNIGLNAKHEFIPGWVDRLIWMGLGRGERREGRLP